MQPLPFDATLDRYDELARTFLARFRGGDPEALEIANHKHPRFLDEQIPWLAKELTPGEIAAAPFDLDDARLVVARAHDFRDWPALAAYVEEVTRPGSAVWLFESAVEAVVNGDAAALREMLREHPELVRARSERVTHFDPPVHRATLLHYVAANGVEGHRQRTPPNAVEILGALLDAGSEPDALASMYGGECATMSLLVSSSHPVAAGLQVALAERLIDGGASLDGAGVGTWVSPVRTALAFSYLDAAEALVRRGARVDDVAVAAGLGRVEDTRLLLPAASAEDRHVALAYAAQLGHADVVRLLLDAGEDPDRFNPRGCHAHSTPLHQAALAGRLEVVSLLIERGARLDIEDTIWRATPLGWAVHAGQDVAAGILRAARASSAGLRE